MVAVAPVSRYVLEGRVVTMGPLGTIDDGAIYVDGNTIAAVGDRADPAPGGFDDAPRIRTGDTIYPGLIELHNHLSYNAMPLWEVPEKYENNGDWRGGDEYSRKITKPTQVLGMTNGAGQAMVRWVEARALLGGVTTTQGITLSSSPGIKKYYRGIVRNVEQPVDTRLPRAGTKIGNPSTNGAQAYLDSNLAGKSCYLQHLSEGIDDTARGWFLNLKIDSDTWAVNDVLTGIHSTALRSEDFAILAEGGASIVWSPLSNYLLYGATTDVAAAKAAGVNIAIGSDWAPSGSKNLLGELKVAWLASRAAGDIFTPEELVAMATVNPAKAAKWDHLLGTIEAGHLADFVVLNGRSGDPHEHLLRARETTVTLVVIDGVPRVGQKSQMKKFWPGHDLDTVDGMDRYEMRRTNRYLYLIHPDDLLEGLTLTEAEQNLRQAMADLPQLATELDGTGATLEAIGTLTVPVGMFDAQGDQWRVVPDFEEDDFEREVEAMGFDAVALARKPYAFWVTEPIELDPITVVDDRNHLVTLVNARNLPDHVRDELPGLYGRSISRRR